MTELSDDDLWTMAVDESAAVRYDGLHGLVLRSIDARELDQALTISQAALDAAQASKQDDLLADAWAVYAGVLWELNRHDEAVAALLDSIAYYEAADMLGAVCSTYIRLSMCMAEGGMIESALATALKGMDAIADEPFFGAIPHMLLEVADRLGQLGRHGDGLALVRASREYSLKHDARHDLDSAKLHEVQLLHESGQSDMALAMLTLWRDEAVAARSKAFIMRASLGLAVILNDTEQYQRCHMLVRDALREHSEDVEPRLLVDLIYVDAQALRGMDDTQAALERVGEAHAVATHWGELMVGADFRIRNYDFCRAQWLLELDQPAAAEPLWRGLTRTSDESVHGMLANYLAYTLIELERPEEARRVLEQHPAPEAFAEMLDGVHPMWHECLLSQTFMAADDWASAAAVAERALAATDLHVSGTEAYLAELWETRALEIVDRDPEAAAEMFSKSIEGYQLAEDEGSREDVVQHLDCTLALIASRWDRQPVS